VLLFARIGLPVLIALAGVVLILMGHGRYTSVFANRDSLLSAVGVGFIVIGLMVWLLNWMLRMSAESDDDRAKEEEARQHFLRTGHWPSED
jgi:hypothetical protein